ncbi:sensor histidine kinase [Microtetraspora malaysiensis]|uniref:sensor histidine kinase n=1 Tax=Microtetraspora malaysiensis TaxID=161358 RepID=UPI003D90CE97
MRSLRFAHQVLALQIVVVMLVAGSGFALAAWLMRDELTVQYGERAVSVARALAADPSVAVAAALDDPAHLIQPRAEAVRAATGALFVVVTDRRGIRLSHPRTELIGRRVSTDPSGPLSGRDVVTVEQGTLGLSARGKVPLRTPDGRIVGEVSVGFAVQQIHVRVGRVLVLAALFTGAALLLGVVGSAAIGHRLRRQTLGLEPSELGELISQREAVLHGIGEGVLAVDADGRVTVCNAEAVRLLGLGEESPEVLGRPFRDLPLPPRLQAALGGADEAASQLVVADDRVLVVGRRQVRREGRELGTVLTLRDRTDLEKLTRELHAERDLLDALRAQRHEHANRLHTVAGLLQLGHHEQAADYLHMLTVEPLAAVPGAAGDVITDPHLLAFLAAKAAVAAERGIRFIVAPGSWAPGEIVSPLDVTTVVGNLVDNALEAAQEGADRPAHVEVELLRDGADLHVTVTDSGEGVPPELADAVFEDGFTTKTGDRPRGLGLALARQVARARGGDIVLGHGAVVTVGETERAGAARPSEPPGRTPRSERDGTMFLARLPGVLS